MDVLLDEHGIRASRSIEKHGTVGRVDQICGEPFAAYVADVPHGLQSFVPKQVEGSGQAPLNPVGVDLHVIAI